MRWKIKSDTASLARWYVQLNRKAKITKGNFPLASARQGIPYGWINFTSSLGKSNKISILCWADRVTNIYPIDCNVVWMK